MISWIALDNDRWENEIRVAREFLIDVSFEVAKDGCGIIYGTLYVEREQNKKIGPFFLKILYPPDFPHHDPNIYLMNHENWREGSNHIEDDGSFCWTEVKDSPIDFYRLDSLRLLGENIAFRLAQVEIKTRRGLAHLPGPERLHSVKGTIQASAERKRRGIGPNTKPCICGRDIKYKKCHGLKEVYQRK